MKANDMIEIQSVKEHKEIKDELLRMFSKVKVPRIVEGDNISNSDYGVDIQREYLSLVTSIILPYTFKKQYRAQIVNAIWFQQYEKNDFHHWHIHGNSHFSHIYFVELPDKNSATEFYKDKLIKINVKEGDLVTFPSYMIHRAPKNKSKKRKSIISFNTTFDEVFTKNIKID